MPSPGRVPARARSLERAGVTDSQPALPLGEDSMFSQAPHLSQGLPGHLRPHQHHAWLAGLAEATPLNPGAGGSSRPPWMGLWAPTRSELGRDGGCPQGRARPSAVEKEARSLRVPSVCLL